MLAPTPTAFRKTLRWSLSSAVVLFLLCSGLAIQPFAYSAPTNHRCLAQTKPAWSFH